jgi:hypothetical protein
VVHGASDVSDLYACNQCLCGVWVSSKIRIEQILISLITGTSEGGFRSRDERKRAEKCEM